MHSKFLTPLVLLTTLAAPFPAVSQSLKTPAACNKAAIDSRTAQVAPSLNAYLNATDSTRPALMAKYSAASVAAAAGVKKMAADCAAQFDFETIAPLQVMDLIALYTTAGDTAKARKTTDRLLTGTGFPQRVQGQAYTVQMKNEVAKDAQHFGILDAAEAYMTKIDKLPDSLSDLKLAAHQSMLARYDYLDVADGLRNHATAVIALAKKMNVASSPKDMIGGYSLLARSYADKLHPDSALQLLDKAEKELGAPATSAFKDFRNRYALIGTHASAITAAWWINPDAKTFAAPVPGKVTLIEFSAHWCIPCKNSYPGLRSLAEHFKGAPFQGVMVTQLYGYLGTKRGLTPEQEVDADKEYFGMESSLSFPVAINAQIKVVPGKSVVEPQPDTDYRVGGIPQIIIVDKHGIIRQIVTGWDQGNTERFTKLIEGLLKEKVTQ